ncbi:MAG: cytochrome c3 family protein [Gallionellaceae bacterium]
MSIKRGMVFLVVCMAMVAPIAHGEYADVVLNRHADQEGMRPVIFPHWFHRLRFTCNVCHPEIFKMRAGSNDVSMAAIIAGNFCGKCHNGEIAWSVDNCHRCHSGLPGLGPGFYNGDAAGGPSPNWNAGVRDRRR